MTSANDTPNGDFDERLTQALDAALTDGEQLVAQETGDQGQAIALTKTRILVAKAGFAATGELDGHKVSAFDLQADIAVNLRKGPLGAVIQIVAQGNTVSAQGGTPDNVIVFTGPGRVKKAEAFAAQVELLTDKKVNRVDPTAKPAPPELRVVEAQGADAVPDKSKGGRKPKSLAEDVYSEVVETGDSPAAPDLSARAGTSPQPKAESTSRKPDPTPPVVEEEDDDEEALDTNIEYRPNPNLPKPPRRKNKGPNSVLVLLGVTAGFVLIGLAIMAPVREAQNQSLDIVRTNTSGAQKAKLLLNAVAEYRRQVADIMAKANTESAALRSAISSGNKTAVRAIGKACKTDLALEEISKLAAPPGLAEAKGNLTGGLLVQKTAITAASAAADSGSLPVKEILARLDEASAQTAKGMTGIAQTETSLLKQSATSVPAKVK